MATNGSSIVSTDENEVFPAENWVFSSGFKGNVAIHACLVSRYQYKWMLLKFLNADLIFCIEDSGERGKHHPESNEMGIIGLRFNPNENSKTIGNLDLVVTKKLMVTLMKSFSYLELPPFSDEIWENYTKGRKIILPPIELLETGEKCLGKMIPSHLCIEKHYRPKKLLVFPTVEDALNFDKIITDSVKTGLRSRECWNVTLDKVVNLTLCGVVTCPPMEMAIVDFILSVFDAEKKRQLGD